MTTTEQQAIAHFLNHAPDIDMSLDRARSLIKSVKAPGKPQRRRSPSNIFSTLSGRPQPRQGFLSPEVMRAIYQRSEVVGACVDTLIELVCQIHFIPKPKDEEHSSWLKRRRPDEYEDQKRRIEYACKLLDRPNVQDTQAQFHRRILRDLLIYDAGAYERVFVDRYGTVLPVELGAIAGETVEVETDDAGMAIGYWQSYNVLHQVKYEPDEIAYFMLNPNTWSPYGLSAIERAYVSIAADLSAMSYNQDFFSKNAIPPALLAVMGVGEAEFRRMMTQIRQVSADNPHNIHAFRAQRNPDGQAQKIFELIPMSQVSNRDMQFNELLQLVLNRICMAFKVAPSQIGFTEQVTGGIGSGVAETQENLHQNKGVSPLVRQLETVHTETFEAIGWDDICVVGEEENTPQKAQKYQNDLQETQVGIMTINEFRLAHGGRSPVDWGDQPLHAPQGYQPPPSPQQLAQQAQQQAAQAAGIPPPPQTSQPPSPDQNEQQAQTEAPQQPPTPDLQKSTGKRIVIEY